MQWIYTKDKLPNKRQLVHFVAYGKVYIGNMNCKLDRHDWLWISYVPEGVYTMKDISHWMPMPEVPND